MAQVRLYINILVQGGGRNILKCKRVKVALKGTETGKSQLSMSSVYWTSTKSYFTPLNHCLTFLDETFLLIATGVYKTSHYKVYVMLIQFAEEDIAEIFFVCTF